MAKVKTAQCERCDRPRVTRRVRHEQWLCEPCGQEGRAPNRRRNIVPLEELKRLCRFVERKIRLGDPQLANDSKDPDADLEAVQRFFSIGAFERVRGEEQ